MTVRYFHDLPVYRISSERYYAENGRRLETFLKDAIRGIPSISKDVVAHMRAGMAQHEYEKYGPWNFNEIVGYIRLHFLGSQVRGEYFGQNKSRYGLSRTKVLLYRTHKLAAELNIPSEATNEEILAIILRYVADCQLELPRRHLDVSWLRSVGPFVDWRALLRS